MLINVALMIGYKMMCVCVCELGFQCIPDIVSAAAKREGEVNGREDESKEEGGSEHVSHSMGATEC
jgi:hypothetical protein